MNDLADYREFFRQLPIPATLIDRDGLIVDVNQAFVDYASVHGHRVRVDERVGRPVTAFVTAPEERRQFGQFIDELLCGASDRRLRWQWRDRRGRPSHAEIFARTLVRDGQVLGAIILRNDITEQVVEQERQELVRALRDEVWHLRGATDLERLLVAVRDGLRRFGTPLNDCGVNLVDPDATTVRAHNMTAEGRWVEAQHERGVDVILEIWRRGEIAYRRDLSRDDAFSEVDHIRAIFGRPIRSVVDVPFSRGTLAANSVEPDAFSEADLQLLAAMARVLGEGFDRAADLEALRQSEERYRAVVGQSADAILLVDLETHRILETNAACQRLLGYRAEELAALRTLDIVAHDRDSILANARRVVEEGQIDIGERLYRRRDGSLVDVEVSLSRIDYGSRQVACGVARDITERRRAERQRLALQGLRDEIWQMQSVRDIGRLLDVARASLESMGVSFDHFGINVIQDERLVPVRVFSRDIVATFVSPTRTGGPNNVVLEWSRGGRPVYRPDLLADDPYGERDILLGAYGSPVRSVVDVPFSHGTVAVNSVRPQAFDAEAIASIQAVAKALSEGFRRTDDLRRLQTQREHLLVTLRSIGDGVVTTDDRGQVQIANAAAGSICGWSEEEVRGRLLHEVLNLVEEEGRQRVADPVTQALQAGAVGGRQNSAVLIRRDGSERLLTYSCAPIRDDRERAIGAVLVFQDVTHRRRTEEGLARSAKLESLGVLAGGIAHDFNNILTGITGNLSLARLESGAGAGTMGELLASAERAAHRAAQLTGQLLSFARGGAPVRRHVRLGDLSRETALFALRGSNVRSHLRLPEDLWWVHGDASQLAQVVQNLVINADQAMPDGGELWLAADNVVVEAHEGLPLAPGRYVRLTVRDTGVGIPPAMRDRIFEPYFTTKERGSGLGLATAYTVVRNHDGHIGVESDVGAGATFTIHLPAVDAVPGTTAEEPRGRARSGGQRVLVMDDEAMIRDLLAAMLANLGYEPEVTATGQEAIAAFARARERGRPFAAVILDLTVPGAMGGVDAVRELRRLDPQLVAIVSSGYSSDPALSDPQRFGFQGVVPKPYKMADMARVLAELIEP